MLRIASSSRHYPLSRKRRTIKVPLGTQRFLAAFEGIEGGFAIGASIIVGLSLAGLNREALLTTALITLVVSGFNSASVKYSSEHYLDELDGHEKRSKFKHYFLPAFIEFVCYLAISVLTILPLIFVDSITLAINISILITLALLFLAGYWRGYMLQASTYKDALETTALGVGIILVGFISGIIVTSL